MADSLFRLRINYQKRGRLRFLSHLEITRALERTVRRAGLPYAVSQGFNTHMRYSPGPALPVGTEGLDEYFDVLLDSYIPPVSAYNLLAHATVPDIPILSVFYVDPKAKGLQATHTKEIYRVVLSCNCSSSLELERKLRAFIEEGELTVKRKGKLKTYDLTRALPVPFSLEVEADGNTFIITMSLLASEQGSIRPENLIEAAMGPDSDIRVNRVMRIRLVEES